MKRLTAVLAGAVVVALFSWASIFSGGGEEATIEPVALEGKWAAILAATPTPSPTPTPTAVTTPTPKPTATPEPGPIWTWTATPTPEPVVVVTAAVEERIATPVPKPRPIDTPAAIPTVSSIATATPIPAPTATPTPIATPSPVPTPKSAIHVGDLDTWGGFSGPSPTGWVRIVVHDAQHNPVMYTYVYADFFLDGVFYSRAHMTGGGAHRDGIVMYWQNGWGTTVLHVPPGVLTYRVTNLRTNTIYGTQEPRDYDSTQNHDPDGDSDGTSIEIAQQ